MTESAELEIKDDEYCVRYNSETTTVTFQGELQLNGMDEYAPIMTLLDEAVNQQPSVLTLDLRQLEFLNSSGVNVLLSLVIKLRDKKTIQLIVEGSEAISWQSRSLNNIRRLMPTAQLNIA
jgi:anti-anti-sigma factor